MHSTWNLIDLTAASERKVADFFGSLSRADLLHREDDAWTTAEHLDHLNRALQQVARGFSLPAWLLRIAFGRAGRPSRSWETVRAEYLSRLALGAGATGRYIPSLADIEAEDPLLQRTVLLSRWHHENERLREALHRWSDSDLDSVRMPHPILGRITAREMIFFTTYHNEHHVAAARRRLPRIGGSGGSGESAAG